MSSPITFGGFNQIDFTSILNAVMQQESAPVTALQRQQAALKARDDSYSQLASKLASIQSASEALASDATLVARKATTSNASALGAAASASAATGTYQVVVQAVARAQVTASADAFAAADIVATSGRLTIGDAFVDVPEGGATLQQLADAINTNADMRVTAGVVTVGADQYRLVLTGKDTGSAGAFSVSSALTGGVRTLAFAANAVEATDARLTVNQIEIVSGSNTVENAIPGVSLALLHEDPNETMTVTVDRDWEDLKARVSAFVTAYNNLVAFSEQQTADAAALKDSSLARESVFRSLRSRVRDVLLREYGTGSYNALARVGLELDRTGRLNFNKTAFDEAVAADPGQMTRLFAGGTGTDGLFDELASTLKEYTGAGGVLPDTQARLDDQVKRLDQRIADMQARLAIRRAALQKEYMAADMAMSRMNSQVQSLSAIGQEYRLF